MFTVFVVPAVIVTVMLRGQSDERPLPDEPACYPAPLRGRYTALRCQRGIVLSADDRRAIEAVHSQWLDAELRNDIRAVLRLCTAEPVWMPPDHAPLCGTAAIERWLEAQPRERVRRVDIDRLVMDGLDSFAWKAAMFRTTVDGPAGTTMVMAGTHGWLLQRDEAGTWRVAVVTWT